MIALEILETHQRAYVEALLSIAEQIKCANIGLGSSLGELDDRLADIDSKLNDIADVLAAMYKVMPTE